MRVDSWLRIEVSAIVPSQRNTLTNRTYFYTGLGLLSLDLGKLSLICQIYYSLFSPIIPTSIFAVSLAKIRDNGLSLTAVPTPASPIATDPVGSHEYNRESVAFLFTARKANFCVGGCCEFVVRPDPLPFFPVCMGGGKYKPFSFDWRKPCLGCLKGW